MGQFSHDARDEQAAPHGSDGWSGRQSVDGSWNAQNPPAGGAFYRAPQHAPARRHRGWAVAGGALVVAGSLAVGAGFGATVLGQNVAGAPPVVVPSSSTGSSVGSGSTGGGSGVNGFGNGSTGGGSGGGSGVNGFGNGSTGSGNTAARSTLPRATPAEEVGVVDINTVLGYQGAEAAGTGMVLTADGQVLTNNHVVDGATSIKVTVVATGRTYTAKVVGTDPTQDVAVIQLQGASGLKTVRTAASAATVSQKVTGVGNAGGVGGAPSAAAGRIIATGATITATDAGGANPETLHALIQTSADIQAGDSGGPLYNSTGSVVGMDTAAQATASGQGTGTGYAIAISTALNVARQIESGVTSNTIHQGYPAFLGISVVSDQSGSAAGADVQQTLANSAAAAVGITAGDVITAVGTTQITSPAALTTSLAADRPGQHVRVTWTDVQGQSHVATVTLGAGPAA